jgi:hypothetical protein
MVLLLLACTADTNIDPQDSGADTPRDLRTDVSVAKDADFVIQSPDYLVPPNEQLMFCYWGTWEGPTTGVNYYEFLQSPGFGHHAVLTQVQEDASDAPDGTWVQCGTGEDQEVMSGTKPLIAGNEVVEPGHGRMTLPEGKAVKILEGQRWMLQSHYINSLDVPILVRDLAWGKTVPQEEVEAWVGSYTFNHTGFSLPPQQATSISFDCSWNHDLHILSMAGHMHGAGRSIFGATLGEEQPAEEAEVVYDVPVWNEDWRYAPQILMFPDDGLEVKASDRLYGQCDWYNDTDTTLTFPNEMCVLMGLAWPLEQAIGCDGAHPPPG